MPSLLRARVMDQQPAFDKGYSLYVLTCAANGEFYDIGDVILETCPTKILLPNPEATNPASRAFYDRIGLNDRELQLIQTSLPKRDYYVVSPLGRRLIGLGLGRVALSFVGVNGREERQRAESFMEKHGGDWQTEWLRSHGLVDWAEYYQDIDKYQEIVCAKAS